MFVMKRYRWLGIGQMMPDAALGFEKESCYSNNRLFNPKDLQTVNKLYPNNGFADIPSYNDDYRADVFMSRKL